MKKELSEVDKRIFAFSNINYMKDQTIHGNKTPQLKRYLRRFRDYFFFLIRLNT